MELKNDIELANTRTKLAELVARYEALRADTTEDINVREVTIRSLKRYINQFKEEITRYETCLRDHDDHVGTSRGIQSETELLNTRRKLHRLEELLESNRNDAGSEELRRAERISLKRLINQFKEEIARYEAHQPAR